MSGPHSDNRFHPDPMEVEGSTPLTFMESVERKWSEGKLEERFLINSSRGIIFASSGEDYARAARKETLKLHEQISSLQQSTKFALW